MKIKLKKLLNFHPQNSKIQNDWPNINMSPYTWTRKPRPYTIPTTRGVSAQIDITHTPLTTNPPRIIREININVAICTSIHWAYHVELECYRPAITRIILTICPKKPLE